MNSKPPITSLGKVALSLLLLIAAIKPPAASAQGTAFSYQGALDSGGSSANGNYDFTFSLYTNATTGVVVIGPITNAAVVVSNGVFSTTIDFGAGVFNSTIYWLGLAVRTNGTGAFVTLTNRQAVLPVPYAVYASNSYTAITASFATAVTTGSVTASSIASGQVVKSINDLHDAVVLAPGTNIAFATSGNTVTISASGGGLPTNSVVTSLRLNNTNVQTFTSTISWTNGQHTIQDAGGNLNKFLPGDSIAVGVDQFLIMEVLSSTQALVQMFPSGMPITFATTATNNWQAYYAQLWAGDINNELNAVIDGGGGISLAVNTLRPGLTEYTSSGFIKWLNDTNSAYIGFKSGNLPDGSTDVEIGGEFVNKAGSFKVSTLAQYDSLDIFGDNMVSIRYGESNAFGNQINNFSAYNSVSATSNNITGPIHFGSQINIDGTASTASNQVFGANNLLTGALADARYVFDLGTAAAGTVTSGSSETPVWTNASFLPAGIFTNNTRQAIIHFTSASSSTVSSPTFKLYLAGALQYTSAAFMPTSASGETTITVASNTVGTALVSVANLAAAGSDLFHSTVLVNMGWTTNNSGSVSYLAASGGSVTNTSFEAHAE